MKTQHEYFVYILSNSRGTLYTGVTSNLPKRIFQHSNRTGSQFTARYHIDRLIYFEKTDDIFAAIQREKEIKSWSRKRKLELIRTINPKFRDLSDALF
jgi:putative endonuclease